MGLNCNKFLFKILIKTSPQIPFLVALNEEGSPSTCTAGHAIPSQTLHVPLTWAHLCPAMNFTCSGKVSRWEFQSVRDDGTSVYLSVWRNNGPNRYQLVGYNVYNATRTGLIRYIVPEDEQILVQTNDFVGIYYDHKFRTGVVPFADPDHLGPFTEGQLYRCLNFPLNQDDVQNAMDTVGYLTADTNFVTRIPSARAFIEPGAPTDCGPLPDVKGGILQGQASNQLGSVVTIVCQPGFTRSGPSTITCTQQGIWSEFPTCTSTLSFLKHSPALLKYIFFATLAASSTCGSAPAIPNGRITSLSWSGRNSRPGDVVSYSCFGSQETASSLSATCQNDGKWSQLPTCLASTACTAGAGVLTPSSPPTQDLNDPGNWLNICPSVRFTCAGQLNRWEFYSNSDAGSVYLGVWRRIGQSNYYLVGTNVANATGIGKIVYDVPPEERIMVQPGDFLGLYYDSEFSKGVVPFGTMDNRRTYPSSDVVECISIRMFGYEVASQMRNKNYITLIDPNVRRVYEWKAYIQAVPTCGPIPQVYNATQFGESAEIGSVVRFRCLTGFTIVGPDTIVCNANGQWSVAPRCEGSHLIVVAFGSKALVFCF